MKLCCNFVLILLQTNLTLTKAYGQKYDYIGCFQWVRSPLFEIHDDVEDCAANCKFTNPFNNMIGLKNGRECHCVSGVSSAVASWRCNMFCKNFSCGGVEFYSVYKIQPRQEHDIYYCHVYPDKSETAIYSRNFDNLDSLEMCAHFCLEMNMTFFRKTIFHNKCDCFQEVNYGLFFRSGDESFRAELCSKSEAEICEYYFESLRDLPTIFSTRLFYEFQRGVSTFSHCKSINYEIEERCPEGCSEGWKGDSCRERDCTRNNGDCGDEMKCIESTVNGNKYVECVCPLGTVRNKWDLCEVFRENVALSQADFLNCLVYTCFICDPNNGLYNGYFMHNSSNQNTISVVFHSLYSIGYIRIYGRLCENEIDCSQLDKFVVKLGPSDDARNLPETCGYGPDKAIQAGNPMNVICKDFTYRSRLVVLLQSEEKIGTVNPIIAELEAYEVSCGVLNGRCEQRCTESKDGDAHVVSCSSWTDEQAVTNSFYGCYLKVSGDLHYNRAGLSYMQCKDACTLMSKSLAVMQAGFKCYCGSSLNIAGNIPVEDCKKGHYRSNLIFDDCDMQDYFCNKVNGTLNIITTTSKATKHDIYDTNSTETLETIVIINPSDELTDITSLQTQLYDSYNKYLVIASGVTPITFLFMLALLVRELKFKRVIPRRTSETSGRSATISSSKEGRSSRNSLSVNSTEAI
ncbi:hypothetical protein HELRODRAFT_176353 [Helobdella robusta]|uniref:WSC domain-containing protein n=1 Tax=Helobdella robusta TaxID=6412 RepID=T1FAF4_HELRO|nr:hypothetical protein HELRODRAFT_176353 [Helobdella robusta]ESO00045.1 hypothetical protein HELRODRAFT_176353 [Helobdella robusta]